MCRQPLNQTNQSREHIIPNALGGRIVTTSAICKACNSNAGSSIDAHIVSELSIWANVFDLPRDRGSHPIIRLTDSSTGLHYDIAPGNQPELSPNPKISKRDNSIEISFYAKTKEKAEKWLQRNASAIASSKRVVLFPSEVDGTSTYTLSLSSFCFHERRNLRSITKIASTFARHTGLQLPAGAIGPRFLQGCEDSIIPVAAVPTPVTKSPTRPEKNVYHSIVLFTLPHTLELYAYVELFGVYDFIVLLDDRSFQVIEPIAYHFNIVTTMEEIHQTYVLPAAAKIKEWLQDRPFPVERLISRTAGIQSLARDMNSVWLDREVARASREIIKLLDQGAAQNDAVEIARKNANRRLDKYGLSFETLEFTPTNPTG